MLCRGLDRLAVQSLEQVRAIRELAHVHSAEQIAERIGARNAGQVQRVIDGKTYVRVT
jgi:hypothetical protein